MPNRLPKVSVLLITYNQEEFVRDALESILIQDYPNFEVVAADDASTDRTTAILRTYAEAHPQRFVLLLNHNHGGITANCNSGLRRCSGEVITPLAGDDLFLPGRLAAQAAGFEDPDVVLCYSPVEMFNSASGEAIEISDEGGRAVTTAEDIIELMGFQGGPSYAFRASAVPVGGFEPRLAIYSDWLFLVEVAAKGKVATTSRPLGRYRRHLRNVTNRDEGFYEEALLTFDLMIQRCANRPSLVAAARRTRARFFAERAYRRLMVAPYEARELFDRAVADEPANWRYRIGRFGAQYSWLRRIAVAGKRLLRQV